MSEVKIPLMSDKIKELTDELTNALKENAKLKIDLKREQDCVDFYANKKIYMDTHKGAPRFMVLPKEDGEKSSECGATFGGRLARLTQELRG